MSSSNPPNTNPTTAIAALADRLFTQLVGQLLGATSTGGLSVIAPAVTQLVDANAPKLRARLAAVITEIGQVGGMAPEELEVKAKAALAHSADPDLVGGIFAKAGIPKDLGLDGPATPPPPPPPPPVARGELHKEFRFPVPNDDQLRNGGYTAGQAVWVSFNRWCVTEGHGTEPKIPGTSWDFHHVIGG